MRWSGGGAMIFDGSGADTCRMRFARRGTRGADMVVSMAGIEFGVCVMDVAAEEPRDGGSIETGEDVIRRTLSFGLSLGAPK